jgi:hypothetical protein
MLTDEWYIIFEFCDNKQLCQLSLFSKSINQQDPLRHIKFKSNRHRKQMFKKSHKQRIWEYSNSY